MFNLWIVCDRFLLVTMWVILAHNMAAWSKSSTNSLGTWTTARLQWHKDYSLPFALPKGISLQMMSWLAWLLEQEIPDVCLGTLPPTFVLVASDFILNYICQRRTSVYNCCGSGINISYSSEMFLCPSIVSLYQREGNGNWPAKHPLGTTRRSSSYTSRRPNM